MVRLSNKYYHGGKIIVGLAGHVACMGRRKSYIDFLGKREGNIPLGRSSEDGRILLEWIF